MDGHAFAMQKTAGIIGNVGSQIAGGFAGGLDDIAKAGAISAGALTATLLGGFGAQKVIDAASNSITRKALLEDLVLNDPIISQADEDQVKQYFATIHHLAPKLSQDKNIVRELLQNFIKFGRVDLASIKALADTQKSMIQGQEKLKDWKI